MSITAQAVKSLRDRTGAGMMDCKRALLEVAGDEEKAIDLLRQWGAAKAAKRTERETSEGVVAIAVGEEAAAMVEVTSETDFVARNEEFQVFAHRLAEAVAGTDLAAGEAVGGDALLERPELAELKAELEDLRSRIGENLQVQSAIRFAPGTGETLGSYLHFGSKIGVLVELAGRQSEEADQVAKGVAMHIAAARPAGVTPDDIPAEERERERAVLTEQTRREGKPEHIIEKIVEGRMRKFYEQNALLMQPFVREPETSVGDVLKRVDPGLTVRRFARFEIGS